MIPASVAKQKKLVLRALEGEATDTIPFWLMRQAGRYLSEYRALREKAGSFMNLCFNPEMACEVTLQPLRRFDMDAAILFSDILVVPYALGQELAFVEGEGPKLGILETERLSFDVFEKKLSPVYDTLRLLKQKLSPEKTLLGFAGAPFTLACYMTEGKGDGKFAKACSLAAARDEGFEKLMRLLTEAVTKHLLLQIQAGADAVQLFDSWAGLLDGKDFEKWVVRPARDIVSNIRRIYPGFPVIGFPRGAGKLYPSYAIGTKISCLSIDQHTTLDWVADNTSPDLCLQGNLDPEILLAGGEALKKETLAILETMKNRPFIFNLGHGVIKETPPENIATLGEIIRGFKR